MTAEPILVSCPGPHTDTYTCGHSYSLAPGHQSRHLDQPCPRCGGATAIAEEAPNPGDFNTAAEHYPPASELLVREFDPIPEWVARGFPTKPAKLEAAIARYFRDRDLDAARYEELRIRGAEALSQYDRMMQGDDGALRTALSLKFNHISYQMMHLQFARTTWPTLYQFIQDSPAPPPQPPEAEPEEDPEDFGLATDPGEVLEDLGIADDSQLSLF